MTQRREIRHKPSVIESLRLSDRDHVATQASKGERTKISGDSVNEVKEVDNYVALVSGAYGGLRLSKQDTTISGSPGSKMTEQSLLSGRASVSGVEFQEEVSLSAAARVRFFNCTFRRLVNMASGAQARFLGCNFIGKSAVNNAGAAANAQAHGCARMSGVAHVNVTLVGGEILP